MAYVLRWLCAELVWRLLVPVHTRWKQQPRHSVEWDRYSLRFARLVNACDCWPCRVSYGSIGPLVVDPNPAADDEDFFPEAAW